MFFISRIELECNVNTERPASHKCVFFSRIRRTELLGIDDIVGNVRCHKRRKSRNLENIHSCGVDSRVLNSEFIQSLAWKSVAESQILESEEGRVLEIFRLHILALSVTIAQTREICVRIFLCPAIVNMILGYATVIDTTPETPEKVTSNPDIPLANAVELRG